MLKPDSLPAEALQPDGPRLGYLLALVCNSCFCNGFFGGSCNGGFSNSRGKI